MKTLVIIGAGFSGAVTAVHFLQVCKPGTRVVLLNRSGEMARGLAYGTNSSRHLLNVPAGNMTALIDQPDHFLRFCETRLPGTSSGSFVPRKLYGEYLSGLLAEAEHHCRDGVSFERITTEAHGIEADKAKARIRIADGREILADHVILAFGNFSPFNPVITSIPRAVGRYLADPWSGEIEVPIDPRAPVLLLGAGLTALDVALTLDQQGHTGPVYMLSRRGVQPLPHRTSGHVDSIAGDVVQSLLASDPTVRSYLRHMRSLVRVAAKDGVDWRDVVAAVRPITAQLWTRLNETERRRFLRHVQVYWDAHRHRVAPASYAAFSAQMAQGRLKPVAGRIQDIEALPNGLRVQVGVRGTATIESLEVSHIINCTGPNSNLARVDDRLISQLRQAGLIRLDTLGLGICVDEALSVQDAQGDPVSWLSYVGPMLKAQYWEATAVPELRRYARDLARRIAAKIG
ncbi:MULTISPECIES: FAD/NAD(P)-binding protein [Pseudomonas]|uniref:FAD/NAD(P)-binding protein n=1 Tax=Pseudomonas TaxID=286 RepID=UPI001A9DC901|nr:MULTISPECIES: FAD/NAD(P)-binding protein [Pseudomonas]MDH1256824.1 FAD/NAD(P)-binding protein [Pseudomonas atacamensis]MEB2856621.1 FAD/NAD(P)-binding protein [Pseudomonas atacamensis]